MKYLFQAMILVTYLSCNNPQKQPVENVKIDTRKIEPILDSLINKYPNYTDNSIVRENATKELDKKIDSLLNMGYLSDIPLKVFRIGKKPHKKGALVQFYTYNYNFNRPSILSDRLNFDLIGYMDETLASTLKEEGTYYIYGKNFKRLNEKEVFLIVNQVYHSPGTEISKEGIGSSVFNFNIGDMSCEIDSIKLIE